MEKYQAPVEPTGMAKLLGIPLGVFDSQKNQYTVTVEQFNPEAINFFKTLHGGAIQAACDDICGMTIYFRYGVNSAVTDNIHSHIFFKKPVRPTSKLTFTCQITSEVKGHSRIFMYIDVKRDGEIIAYMTAEWHLTQKFLDYLEEKEKTSTQ